MCRRPIGYLRREYRPGLGTLTRPNDMDLDQLGHAAAKPGRHPEQVSQQR